MMEQAVMESSPSPVRYASTKMEAVMAKFASQDGDSHHHPRSSAIA